MIQHDVLIVGGGLAGMRAAYEAKSMGADVAMVSKIYPTRSHSAAAQGGMQAALTAEDSWESHSYDTVKGSDFLGDQDAIQILCREGIDDIITLERMGVIFNRTEDGKIDARAFGGTSAKRTCFVADQTGQVILHVMWEQLLKQGLKCYDEWFVMELVVEEGRCTGVVAMQIATGQLHLIRAKSVVLCTGGIGQVYSPTTNGLAVTADGMALAYRAGASLMDMEMVQHHPTCLHNGILITEGARGEGAYLLNANGDRFMSKYAPKFHELASRDVVSRSEQTEINEGRGVNGFVFLDLRHLGREAIMTKLSQIYYLARDYAGVNVIEQPLPIRPGHHYMMGGIKTDTEGRTWDISGQNKWTGIPGLFAAGETANVSVHGGNRLGGNSLLDTVVFGRRSGRGATEYARTVGFGSISEEMAVQPTRDKIKRLFDRPSGLRAATLRFKMGRAMNDGVAVFRSEETMSNAQRAVREAKADLSKVSVHNKGRVFNTDLLSVLELEGMLDVAEVIATSALNRKESRGAHSRTDFPERDDENWLKHQVATRTPEGPKLSFLEVHLGTWKPVVRSY